MHDAQGQTLKIVEDATCTFCGCLCDDIGLSIDGDRITDARNACVPGKSWFFDTQQHDPGQCEGSVCLIDGQPAGLGDGIERAASILSEARYPIVLGLADASSQSQRAAVSLADWLGACVDSTVSAPHAAAILALQDAGKVTCTLGEVANRGDFVLFWGCDPVETHPRHVSRYSLEPAGLFVPRGRADRYCVVIDVRETATARAADQFIAVKPGRAFEALWTLRALAKGVELDAEATEAETGAALSTWQALMARMKQARYGVIFHDESRGSADGFEAYQNSYALLTMVRDLNAHARFVCLSLGGRGNGTGAINVSTWQTGYPMAVSLTRGYPRFGPRDYQAAEILARGESDAALIVAGDPAVSLPEAARAHLKRIATVALVSSAIERSDAATVVFRVGSYGIHTPGTVYRTDGVAIPLRAAVPSALPSTEDIVKAIEDRVRQQKAATEHDETPNR